MLIQYTAKSGKSYEKECCLSIPNFAGSVIKKPVNTKVLTGFCLCEQIKMYKKRAAAAARFYACFISSI